MGIFSRNRMSESDFIEPDAPGRLIQDAIEELEEEGELESEHGGPPPRFNGYCARACQAYVHLVRDERAAQVASHRNATVRVHREKGSRYGESHYWLKTEDGIMDLNHARGEFPDLRVPGAETTTLARPLCPTRKIPASRSAKIPARSSNGCCAN